jgi:protein CpxP
MMKIRRFATRFGALAVCGVALTAVPMLAQGGGGGRMQMTPEQQTAALDKAVTLTPDQKTQVMALYTADAKKMADLRASGADPADMRPKMMAMRTDEQTAIKAMLTDEQKPKYDAMLAAMPQGRRGGGGGAGGGGGMPPPAPPQQ